MIEHIFTTLLLTEHWATDRLERPRMPTYTVTERTHTKLHTWETMTKSLS